MAKNNCLNRELLTIEKNNRRISKEKNLKDRTCLSVLKVGIWRLIDRVENKAV